MWSAAAPGAAARPGPAYSGSLARRLIFAVPLRDVHSPCRLHRLDKLAAIPLQSASSFLDTEILAKATFLGHLIDEVTVPPLRGQTGSSGLVDGLESSPAPSAVCRSSGPAEEPQCQSEGDDGPGGEDQDGRADIEQARPLEQHPAQAPTSCVSGRAWMKGWAAAGNRSDEKKTPEKSHIGSMTRFMSPLTASVRAGAAGDQQTDSGERERAKHVDADHESQAAADRHVEHERSQEEQDSQVRDHEREPGPQEGEQEIAPGHGRGHEPLEQFGDAEVDEQKADAPEPAPHGVQPDQARDQEVDVA